MKGVREWQLLNLSICELIARSLTGCSGPMGEDCWFKFFLSWVSLLNAYEVSGASVGLWLIPVMKHTLRLFETRRPSQLMEEYLLLLSPRCKSAVRMCAHRIRESPSAHDKHPKIKTPECLRNILMSTLLTTCFENYIGNQIKLSCNPKLE
jgi:hypothetical protein